MTYNKKVIELKLPKEPWRFFGIEYQNRTRPVDDWFKNDLSDDAKFALRDTLRDAQKIEIPTHWTCFRKFLKGKYAKYKIWELEFSCGDNLKYRVLGVFGSERKQAIFLVGCHHKGKVYTPTDALDSAFTRARDLATKKATIYERKIPTSRQAIE